MKHFHELPEGMKLGTMPDEQKEFIFYLLGSVPSMSSVEIHTRFSKEMEELEKEDLSSQIKDMPAMIRAQAMQHRITEKEYIAARIEQLRKGKRAKLYEKFGFENPENTVTEKQITDATEQLEKVRGDIKAIDSDAEKRKGNSLLLELSVDDIDVIKQKLKNGIHV